MTQSIDFQIENGTPCWTRLSGSEVYKRAHTIQAGRAVHVFRNWQLTCRYYRNAQDLLHYEYSRALDLAILTWGSIACIDGDRGSQAISWVSDQLGKDDPDIAEVSRILSGCANIDFSEDPRLIFVTLADLADIDLSRRNLVMIKEDAVIRHRMDGPAFYASFNDFLSRLKARMRKAPLSMLTSMEQDMHRKILEGIKNLQMHALDVENMERTSDG